MSSKDSTSDSPTSLTPPSEKTDKEENENDRTSLIEKARAFLLSPTVRHEDEVAKRRFLEEKGLTGNEVDELLRELPRQPPPVPPRTYPPLPPSNLPFFLALLFRVLTWTAGISSVLLLGYYRFLFPRITRSLTARHKLKLHQLDLMGRLRRRTEEVRETQTEIYDTFYQPETEVPADIKSLAELPVDVTGKPTHPLAIVVLRAFLDEPERRFTLEELHRCLLKQFPGLQRVEEVNYMHCISRELSRSRTYDNTHEGDLEYWSLRRDTDSSTHSKSLTQSLQKLFDALSQGFRGTNAYQYTFKSLTDFTAFLSRETFALYGASTTFRHGLSGGHPLSPAEEEIRREIRALKGLVLNRRSFAPSPHRPSVAPVAGTN